MMQQLQKIDKKRNVGAPQKRQTMQYNIRKENIIPYLTQYCMPSFCLNSVPVTVCGALRTNLSPAFCITSTFLLPFNCLLVPYHTTIISMWLYQ